MSSSNSSSATSTSTIDGKVAADNGALGISAQGDVTVHMVPDEAFQMGVEAIKSMNDLARSTVVNTGQTVDVVAQTLGTALMRTQNANKSEAGQLSQQIVKIGIPAAALAYIASQVMK